MTEHDAGLWILILTGIVLYVMILVRVFDFALSRLARVPCFFGWHSLTWETDWTYGCDRCPRRWVTSSAGHYEIEPHETPRRKR